jgi:hypothetical protein
MKNILDETRTLAKEVFNMVSELPELTQYDVGQQLRSAAYEMSASVTEYTVTIDAFERKELLQTAIKNLLLVENGVVLLSTNKSMLSTIKKITKELQSRLDVIDKAFNELNIPTSREW